MQESLGLQNAKKRALGRTSRGKSLEKRMGEARFGTAGRKCWRAKERKKNFKGGSRERQRRGKDDSDLLESPAT